MHRAAVATWVLAALLLVADLIRQRYFSDDWDCVLQNTSGYVGTSGWSWMPLGRTCSFVAEQGESELPLSFTFEPQAYVVWLQAAVGASIVGYLIARLRHRS